MCSHEHLIKKDNFYVCEACGQYFFAEEADMEQIAMCVDCNKKFEQHTDLQVCENCMDNFDTDKLWYDHDRGAIDALHFNKSKSLRDKYRLPINPV